MSLHLNTARRSAGVRHSRRDALPFMSYCPCSAARAPGTTIYAQAIFALRLLEQRVNRSPICNAAAQATETSSVPVATAVDSAAADPSTLDIRVGKIVKCEQHPDADRCNSNQGLPVQTSLVL